MFATVANADMIMMISFLINNFLPRYFYFINTQKQFKNFKNKRLDGSCSLICYLIAYNLQPHLPITPSMFRLTVNI